MSLNGIRRDKNGKLLKPGQWVEAELNKDPPIFIFGKIMFAGDEKSFVQPDEKEGEKIENSKIEIKIDVRV